MIFSGIRYKMNAISIYDPSLGLLFLSMYKIAAMIIMAIMITAIISMPEVEDGT